MKGIFFTRKLKIQKYSKFLLHSIELSTYYFYTLCNPNLWGQWQLVVLDWGIYLILFPSRCRSMCRHVIIQHKLATCCAILQTQILIKLLRTSLHTGFFWEAQFQKMINGLFLFLVSRTDRQVRKKSTEVIFFN